MGTVNDMLSLAHSQLGNDGARYWNWYTDNVRPSQGYYVDGDDTPYCAEYISWLLAHTDTSCIYFPNPCAFDADNIAPSDRISKYSLKVGDIVSYDWDDDSSGDHVGLIVRVYDSAVTANEGNCSGYVRERYRTLDDILFGIRPRYSESGSKLAVDGIFGELTVKALQESLQNHGYYNGYYIDGDFGYYTKLELQKYLNYKRYYAYELDGDFAYYSVRALQRYLSNLGYYRYDIDGWWGTETTKALQESLNSGKF